MNKKFIFLTHEFFPFRGGVATYVQELAEATHRLGEDVEVWTNGSPLSGSDFSAPYPIRYVGGQASLRLISRLTFLAHLFKKRHQLDQAFPVYSSYGALFCGMFLSGLGLHRPKRYGVILHGSEILKMENRFPFNCCCGNFLERASFVATTSHHILERLKKSPLGHCDQTAVLTCAPPSQLVAHARLRKHVDGDIKILTLARIHKRKGHIETARALGMLPPEIKKRITWQIAGTGDKNYLAQVLKVCREEVVRYHIIGEVSDENLAWAYGNADIYVMSSRSLPRSIEGFGITYLEAGLFGIPVVGYSTGGVREAVIDGETGFLVEEGNIQALSQALERLICDRSERKKMGLAGKKHAESFTWENSARELRRCAEIGETDRKRQTTN